MSVDVTQQSEEPVTPADTVEPNDAYTELGVDTLTIRFGQALARDCLAPEHVNAVLRAIHDVRREIARDTGLVIPNVQLREDAGLAPNEYTIHVYELRAARGTLESGRVLAIAPDQLLALLDGIACEEPVYGLAAKWIPNTDAQRAQGLGAVVFDPVQTMAAHFGHVARDHYHELLRLDGFNTLVQYLKKKFPVLMREFEAAVPYYTAFRTYKYLLAEQVWPRDHEWIFETILFLITKTNDPMLLAEAARKRLVPADLQRKRIRAIPIVMVDAALERAIDIVLAAKQPLIDTPLGPSIQRQVDALVKNAPKGLVWIHCLPRQRRALATLLALMQFKGKVYASDEFGPGVIFNIVNTLMLQDPTQPESLQGWNTAAQ